MKIPLKPILPAVRLFGPEVLCHLLLPGSSGEQAEEPDGALAPEQTDPG